MVLSTARRRLFAVSMLGSDRQQVTSA